MTTNIVDRVALLNTASTRRVIEPDTDLPGELGPGAILPDELLSINGLDLDLTDEQRAILSREEIASMLRNGILFEAVLEDGFALQIARSTNVLDPRVTFLLHEIGEETRHQRLFQRLIAQIDPQAKPRKLPRFEVVLERVGPHLIVALPALLYTLVLAGEEIPDLLQKKAAAHPDTDPFLAEVNRYHRAEEARHLSYARAVLPEVWANANLVERVAVQRIAPLVINDMFRFLVSPGVYEVAGLPGIETWQAVQALPERIALRHEATRPVLQTLLDGGTFPVGRIPKPWRELCGVDKQGNSRLSAWDGMDEAAPESTEMGR